MFSCWLLPSDDSDCNKMGHIPSRNTRKTGRLDIKPTTREEPNQVERLLKSTDESKTSPSPPPGDVTATNKPAGLPMEVPTSPVAPAVLVTGSGHPSATDIDDAVLNCKLAILPVDSCSAEQNFKDGNAGSLVNGTGDRGSRMGGAVTGAIEASTSHHQGEMPNGVETSTDDAARERASVSVEGKEAADFAEASICPSQGNSLTFASDSTKDSGVSLR